MSRKSKLYNKKCYSSFIQVNPLIYKLTNYLMLDGKKTKAENILSSSLKKASTKYNKNRTDFLEIVVGNIKPKYEVKSRRIGGSTYQVPIEIRPSRSISLALKWLVIFAKKRLNEKTMSSKLASEMCDAFMKKGGAVKKMEDTHKMAEANQAFAHYRW